MFPGRRGEDQSAVGAKQRGDYHAPPESGRSSARASLRPAARQYCVAMANVINRSRPVRFDSIAALPKSAACAPEGTDRFAHACLRAPVLGISRLSFFACSRGLGRSERLVRALAAKNFPRRLRSEMTAPMNATAIVFVFALFFFARGSCY